MGDGVGFVGFKEISSSFSFPGSLQLSERLHHLQERRAAYVTGKDRASCQSGGAPALRPGAIAQGPGREAALAWASLAQRFPASSVLAREGAV